MTAFDPGNRLVVALDGLDGESAYRLAGSLAGEVALFKLGLELFVAEGPAIVRRFVAGGHRVMLDLKLHDIPATVARATRRAAQLGAELLTVHTGGGQDMLGAAVWAAGESRAAGHNLRILAVTVLTSLDQAALGRVGILGRVEDLVGMRARVAEQAGCHGVLASPREAALLRAQSPSGFLIATPGVHPSERAARGAEAPITAPAAVRRAGADLLICGRHIRDAENPAAAARAIAAEIAAASATKNQTGERAR